ncbi:SIMPL domain-containing protein [Ferrimonas balearica]|uniref:SIMPL domain-containing protein n=1 Tax=Ferrimonas balearica TaxID=44012 RepID=UPI002D7E1F9C|nr:SIMPL domain-containing protein [Ferrimonas balearica]MBY6096845.1 SIMPL domain-containing protein [Ferrimonas balearica]
MNVKSAYVRPALILAIGLVLGLAALGYQLGSSALSIKEYERTVTVKGLSEREEAADVVLWPIRVIAAENDLTALYNKLESDMQVIQTFLTREGLAPDAITLSPPTVVDKLAQQYGGPAEVPFRYSASQTLTVYSYDVEDTRRIMGEIATLGKQGIVISQDDYRGAVQYLFLRLNDIKPEMVEEATMNARSVAQKFAEDSQSRLGKIKRASQGQFSISDRDANTPYIKKIRVVSTVEYYLSD